MVLECRNFAGIRIGLGREELKRLKQTTLVTLLSKVLKLLGVKESEYTYSEQTGVITYRNGSQILLIDMKYHPMDPEYTRSGRSSSHMSWSRKSAKSRRTVFRCSTLAKTAS